MRTACGATHEIGSYKELAGGKKGEVYVTKYFDYEAPALYNTFTPKNSTKPLGTIGLFSESGYIVRDVTDSYTWFAAKKTYYYNYYKFSAYYEADSLQSRYDFRYNYTPGDYYEGFFYAPVGMFAQYPDGHLLIRGNQSGTPGPGRGARRCCLIQGLL